MEGNAGLLQTSPSTSTAQFARLSDCSMPCTEDAGKLCGNNWRLSTYFLPAFGGVMPVVGKQRWIHQGRIHHPHLRKKRRRSLRLRVHGRGWWW
ncbi:hypothetical protein BC829DRAFT_26112 [Chytridium lagenaria]|nr:hypothetical protein BC829DRAFT_26112 [Chytridium lagenaria]